ncbi:sensor histidine kinase [Neptuniibacter marinus]|uniref:sensor histidine kinase n=1 Tax=Neptuniibacter marinus TaxID=1806670 RepID=UPI000837010B|nr:HAMP domain-containing sensor histidine kinase [Neptuniibacter marinus]
MLIRSPLSAGITRTLSSKLSIALILILISSSVAMFFAGQFWMKRYNEEITQKINASIVMYITDAYKLIDKDDEKPNLDVIKKLSSQAMIITPIAEVYLLDSTGRIIGHALPETSIQQRTIPLGPIKTFINGDAEFPLHGIDPRDPTQTKIFSAAQVLNNGTPQGYLYVVLGSKIHQEMSKDIKSSHSRSMAVMTLSMISLAAVTAGLLIFSLLINPLSKLSKKIGQFSEQQLGKTLEIKHESLSKPSKPQPAKDEIDQLQQAFTQMAAQIEQQFDQLKDADNSRRELIANVSHDLRTPLASTQGYLETLLIKDKQLTQKERLHYLKTAISSTGRLGLLIGDLFELSKLEAFNVAPKFETFSLAELVYDTLQELELELKEKGIHYQVTTPNHNLNVHADISLIQRVFENLIRNAIAYTPQDGNIVFQLEPQTTFTTKAIKISISDNGAGISQDDLPHIFERFYTNPDKSREAHNSTGLGLAIVKRILELHDSPIKVRSTLNQGTCFEFSLPFAT